TIQGQLASGYFFGNWSGPGIRSSAAGGAGYPRTALGFAEASDLSNSFPFNFSGQSVDGTAVIVRYTLYGDATLNRTVDTIDFNLLAANFSQTPKRWFDG